MSDVQVFDCDQGSPEWFAARLGIPTASKFSDVLAGGKGITRKKYLLTLAGEAITGEVAESYSNTHMERGKIMEEEACDLYAFIYDEDIQTVGFLRRGRAGASPDRLIGSGGMLECKTRLPHLQIDALEGNRLPPEHVAQVQGQLWVSGRQWCDFITYWPRLPLFKIRVERDEKYIETLASAVDAFNEEMDTYIQRYRVAA